MSGSGSTVFAVLHEKPLGFRLGERIAQEFGGELWCYLAETV
jgi:4-diphosphocytidyl-2-C-methyl-D-erythritol kinase